MKFTFTESVKASAMGQWDFALQQTCGLSPKETTPTKKGMPCPNCGGHDRYEFKSTENGFYMCRGCDAGDGFSMIMKMHDCSFSDAVLLVASILGLSEQSHLSPLDIETKRKEFQAAEERQRHQALQNERKAAIRADKSFRSLPYADPHFPYLSNKSVPPHEIKQDKNKIVVPARNVEGEITTLQFIDEEGNKQFMPGGRVTGSFHLIGSIKNEVYIAEGYCTGASVHAITKRPVAIAFTAGNLMAVACALREKYPHIRMVIAADDDRTTENPGLRKAEKAAQAVQAELLIPPFKDDEPGTDWNDWINNRVEGSWT